MEEMQDYKYSIGHRLKQLRKSRKVPVSKIIDRLDIARSTYTGWETGRRSPKGVKLVQLADFYDTTVDYLIGLTDDPSPPEQNLKEILDGKRATWDGKEISKEQSEAIARIIQAYLAK